MHNYKANLYKRKYVIPANITVVPIAIETGGRFHPQSLEFVKALVKQANMTETAPGEFELDKAQYSFQLRDLLVRVQSALMRSVGHSLAAYALHAKTLPTVAPVMDGEQAGAAEAGVDEEG